MNGLPPTANLSEISFIDEDTNNAQAENGQLTDKFNNDLPNPVHETRIWADWQYIYCYYFSHNNRVDEAQH